MRQSLTARTALGVCLALILANLPFWTSPLLREQGDLAANALQVERAREGGELLGPYSQHQFHHPGPISFYAQAVSEPLFFFLPSPLAKHSACQLVLNLLLIVWTLRLMRRADLEPPLAVAGLFLLLTPLVCLAGGNPSLLSSVWGPAMVVFPVVLFVVAVAATLAGDEQAPPAVALGGTIAWHNHLPTVPVLFLLGIALIAGQTIRRIRSRSAAGRRSPRWPIPLTALILVVGLCPPLYEELTRHPGNLTLIARFLRDNAAVTHPWMQVIDQLGQAFTDPLVVLLRFTGGHFHSPAIVLAIVAGLCVVSAMQFRRSAPAWRLIIALTWAAVLITAGAARRASGELHTYLFYYLYGLAGVLYVIVAKEIWDRWLRTRLGPWRHTSAVTALIAFGLLVAWLANHRLAPPPPVDRYTEIISRFHLAELPAVHLERGQGPDDADLWQQIPTLALGLRRAGVRVTVSAVDVILCGEEMRTRPGDASAATLLITRQRPTRPNEQYWPVGDWGAFLVDARDATSRD